MSALAVVVVLIFVLMRSERDRAIAASQMMWLSQSAEHLSRAQADLTGRLEQTQLGVNQRLDLLARRLGDGMAEQTARTGQSLRILHERLAVIDAAQRNIHDLSTQVVALQDILSNKQARGAFGEVQLKDLVSAVLPPSAYAFQATLGNGRRVDCLLRLPTPPGPTAIDAKFPLESFNALRASPDEARRAQAARTFAADVRRHIVDIQERYIVPGETADAALLFLPSEAVYAELHANFRPVVEESYRRKVWIVSPTTLWATLNTLRAVLKDVHLREQAQVIEAELSALCADIERLDKRGARLQEHFRQVEDDVRQIRLSAAKIARRADRIDVAQLGEPPSGPEVADEPFDPGPDTDIAPDSRTSSSRD